MIELNINDTANVSSTSIDYTMHIKTANINLTEYDYDTNSVLTDVNEYIISYYEPVIVGGLITDYTLTNVGIDDVNYVLSNVVLGTPIYFNLVNNEYQVADIKNASSIANMDASGAMSIVVPTNLTANYDVNLMIDYSYAQVNLCIDYNEYDSANDAYTETSNVYATAYFRTTNVEDYNTKPEANSQFVAFMDLILNGNQSSEIFNGTNTTLIKSITKSTASGYSYVKEYYSAEELTQLYQFEINKNLALLHNNKYRNTWFDEFNISTAYQAFTDNGITIDLSDLFVGAGVETLNITANTSIAQTITINSTLETVDNAIACGGFAVEDRASESYSYELAEGTTTLNDARIDVSGVYSTLVIKLKENTLLPKINVVYDDHTYIEEGDINTFNNTFSIENGKNLSEITGLGNVGDDYTFNLDFKVKQVILRLITSDPRNSGINYEFEKDYSNPSSVPVVIELKVNYATTISDILSGYGLSESLVSRIKNGDTTEYNFEFSHIEDELMQTIASGAEDSLKDYLDLNNTYTNNSNVTLYVIYTLVED